MACCKKTISVDLGDIRLEGYQQCHMLGEASWSNSAHGTPALPVSKTLVLEMRRAAERGPCPVPSGSRLSTPVTLPVATGLIPVPAMLNRRR
ncbi:hypothetical protein RRG08_019189 [Elysia crispata]|uniref:Uncharacterized protein n=1 Tax=Elysia crispata TaxID=231223 RepID=A0AAE0ZMS8_9GAST|nr:hypothetical protein RRG08_019189 [Elysia crispata]